MLNDGLRDPDYSFGKHERVRSRQDIQRVFEQGQKHSVKGLRLHALTTGAGLTRALFVTVRKYGNAVQRNRARRVLSESWRLTKHRVATGYDLVFVMYPAEDTLNCRSGQLAQVLRRSGLLH